MNMRESMAVVHGLLRGELTPDQVVAGSNIDLNTLKDVDGNPFNGKVTTHQVSTTSEKLTIPDAQVATVTPVMSRSEQKVVEGLGPIIQIGDDELDAVGSQLRANGLELFTAPSAHGPAQITGAVAFQQILGNETAGKAGGSRHQHRCPDRKTIVHGLH